MKIPSVSLRWLSSFCVFVFFLHHIAYLSPASSPPSVSCYLFVFPFSSCHHKLPVRSVSPSQCSTFSIHMSPSSASVSCLRTPFFFFSPPPLCLWTSFTSPRAAGRLHSLGGCLVSWWGLSCRSGRLSSPLAFKEHACTWTQRHTYTNMYTGRSYDADL